MSGGVKSNIIYTSRKTDTKWAQSLTNIALHVDTWVVNPLTIETILPVVVLSMVVLVTIPAPGVDKEID